MSRNPRPKPPIQLFQILAPHFCAGGEIGSDGKINTNEPVIYYMRGWSLGRVIQYCTRQGWTFRSQGL